MILLRLFHEADPAREIDRRVLTEGEVSIGRGEEVGWSIPDPTKGLSRLHCVLALADGALTVRDESTNGVYLRDGERLPRQTAVPLGVGDRLGLGPFVVRIEPKPSEPFAHAGAARSGTITAPAAGSGAGRLLESFCAGARIDPSVFSGEDPSEVMKRLGEVYREMVLGLGELMNDRTRVKSRYRLEWTTVQAADNNPFRWAPPPRVAVDLLLTPQQGFLTGEAAVRASIEDLRGHHFGLVAGLRAAVRNVVEALDPDAVAESQGAKAFLSKKKGGPLWDGYVQVHGRVHHDVTTWGAGAAASAFRNAYRRGSTQHTLLPEETGTGADALPS